MNPEDLRQLFDPLPEPTLFVGGGGQVVACNRAFVEKFGDPTGRSLLDLAADKAEAIERFLRRCRGSRSPSIGALEMLGADGSPLPCRCSGALIRPAGDAVDALVSIRLMPKIAAVGKFEVLNEKIRDLGEEIQARKQAEERTREREQWLRVTLASIAEGVIVTDPEGKIRSLNPIAESLLGCRESDALGQPLEAFYRTVDTSNTAAECPVAQALSQHAPHSPFGRQLFLDRPDVADRKQVEHSAAPIRDDSGSIVGAVLIFRDVSQREEADRRIAELNERLEFIHGSIGIGTWLNTLPLSTLNWDTRTRELFFVEPGTDPTVDLFFDRLHPDDRDPTRKAVEQALSSHSAFDIEHRVINPATGVVRWLRSQGMPGCDANGVPVRFDGVNYDITVQKENEEELRATAAKLSEVDRRKDEFLAMLAHELRNPLAPLRTGLEILRLSAGKDSSASERTRAMMERQVEQLVVLIDDLMDVSRISRGKLELRRSRIDLHQVLELACEESMPKIDAGGHEFERDIPADPILLDADPNRLAQVFSNLLNNAARYTPAGGTIRLSVEGDGAGCVEISVSDTGMGIPAEKQGEIFNMFAQIDPATAGGQGGLGIGLTLVRSLIEMHGGEVSVSSEGLDCGSRFTVRLPTAESTTGPEVQIQPEEAITFARKKVLIVDDNPAAIASLETLVAMLGHEVQTACNGREAVNLTDEYKPDIVLMDLGMPVMDGYEAARAIRKKGGDDQPVLVAVSGWGSQQDRKRASAVGFDRHLVKPADPKELAALLSASE